MLDVAAHELRAGDYLEEGVRIVKATPLAPELPWMHVTTDNPTRVGRAISRGTAFPWTLLANDEIVRVLRA